MVVQSSAQNDPLGELINKSVSEIKNSTTETVKRTADEIREKTQEQAHKTAHDIREKSEKLSHELTKKSSSILDDVKSFFSGILNDIVGFFKILFGDNTPGQPALADPQETAGIAPVVHSQRRMGTKVCIFAILGVLSYVAVGAVDVYNRRKRHDKEDLLGGYYRNIQVLEENFL